MLHGEFEQPDLVGGIPTHGSGLELDELLSSLPTLTMLLCLPLSFCL